MSELKGMLDFYSATGEGVRPVMIIESLVDVNYFGAMRHLQHGDSLEVFDLVDLEMVVWSGVVACTQRRVSPNLKDFSFFGQEGVEKPIDEWSSWFFKHHQATLKR